MKATRSLAARTPERHRPECEPDHIRLEPLENRLLFARPALANDADANDSSFESPPDEPGQSALVGRETTTTETFHSPPADSADQSESKDAESNNDSTNEPPSKPYPADSNSAVPTRVPKSPATDAAPRQSEPDSLESDRTAAKPKPGESQIESERNRDGSLEPRDGCRTGHPAPDSNRHCFAVPADMAPVPHRTAESHATVTTDRHEAERVNRTSAVVAPPEKSHDTHRLEPPPRFEPLNALPLLDGGLQSNIVADMLNDAIGDVAVAASEPEWPQGALAAGAFAVVFAKPFSRLGSADSSIFGDSAAAPAWPVVLTRKRRKSGGKSVPDSTDRPDDDEPADEPGSRRARSVSGQPDIDPLDRLAPRNWYASLDRAIHLTLAGSSAEPDDSAGATKMFHSARSFATTALAATAAWLTLQRRSRAESPSRLQPSLPTYHGVTAARSAAPHLH